MNNKLFKQIDERHFRVSETFHMCNWSDTVAATVTLPNGFLTCSSCYHTLGSELYEQNYTIRVVNNSHAVINRYKPRKPPKATKQYRKAS